MKIFDRRFLQYQMASLKHNKYKNKVLYPNIILFITALFYRDNIPILLLCLGAIGVLIGYGYFRFNSETNRNDEGFREIIEKKYYEYEKAASKKNADIGIVLQKIAFSVELDKMSPDDAIKQIQDIIKTKPDIKRFANNIILSLYSYKYKDKNKIPHEYIDYLDRIAKTEKNVNVLVDCIKTCISIEEYNRAFSLISKAEEELVKIKKIRKPAYNAIYRTTIVAVPYYKGLTYKHMGNKKKAKESLEEALKKCKSKKLSMIIMQEI